MKNCQLLKTPYSYAQMCYFRKNSRHTHGLPRKGVFYLICSPHYTGCISNVILERTRAIHTVFLVKVSFTLSVLPIIQGVSQMLL